MNRLKRFLTFLLLIVLCLILTGRVWAQDDELLSEENLKKLREICVERRKAYEGVPWEKAYRETVEIKGRAIFEVTCNSTKKVTKRYCKLLKRLYIKYCDVFRAFEPKARTCKIFIFRNYAEFLYKTGVPPGVGGFYQPNRYALYAFHGRLGSLGSDEVIAHEGCHLFQDLFLQNFGFAPVWLVEGMAVLTESAKIEKDGKIHIRGVAPGRLANLQSMIEAETAIPLAKVMSTPRQSFSAEYYAHAGMFTYWLIKGSKKKKLAFLYNDYLRIAAGGTNTRGQSIRAGHIKQGDFEQLCRAFGTSVEKLEKVWKKWVMKQKINRPGKVVGKKFICDEHGIVASSPGPGWKIDLKNVYGSELCVMTNKKVNGRITISVGGTGGTLDLNEYFDMVDRWRQKSMHKYRDYRRIERKIIKKWGLEGYDSSSEFAFTESPITKELQRHRTIAISMMDIFYRINCQADPDKFDALMPYFNKVVDSFRIDASKLE